MIKKEEVYKIGLFNKPHGIHGELQFTFTDDIFDRVDCDYLVCLLDGIFVPFFMEEYRFRSDSTALVKLEGVQRKQQNGLPLCSPCLRMLRRRDVHIHHKYLR